MEVFDLIRHSWTFLGKF